MKEVKRVRLHIAAESTIEIDVGPNCTEDQAISIAKSALDNELNFDMIATSLWENSEVIGVNVQGIKLGGSNVIKLGLVNKDGE